ncbi:MAG: cytochrome c oxidase accessory protein CcoG [Planctomycetota bacterium]|jgi:cytochrome c oxidase accessory protein FixG
MPARHPDLDSLYCIREDGSRQTIHTADVSGRYQRRKKIVWAVLIAIYLVLPWIEVGGKPAILIDIAKRHFYLFGLTFNAQDFYLAFFLLTGLGFSLFVVSALFGRIWCGYACPHTVFLEAIYRRVERWIEGSASQRDRLAKASWGLGKALKRGTKWLFYLGISGFLAHVFLSYFLGVDEVFSAIVNPPSEHPAAFTFVLIFTTIIYFNFTWFREQLCIVICPYGRLQGVLYDADTVNVAYDQGRGEPRGKYTSEERGHCIDCFRCVAVCPTGIDIRNGTQMECIGCANCIDACDEVMRKVDQPTGLIRYDSQRGIEKREQRFLRPRVFLYAFLLLLGLSVFSVAAIGRSPFEANIIRLPGQAYTLEEETVLNPFTVHLYNKMPERHEFSLEVIEPEVGEVTLPIDKVELDSLGDTRLPIFVRVPRAAYSRGMRLRLRVTAGGEERLVEAPLLGPSR